VSSRKIQTQRECRAGKRTSGLELRVGSGPEKIERVLMAAPPDTDATTIGGLVVAWFWL